MSDIDGKFNTQKTYTVRIGMDGKTIQKKIPDLDDEMRKEDVNIIVSLGIVSINGIIIPLIIMNKFKGTYSYINQQTGEKITKYDGLKLKGFVESTINDGLITI